MRMWGIDPAKMCRKHLLGEHVEMHMFVGCVLKNKNINGYLNGLVIVSKIGERHQQLVDEMQSRGYNHKSPLPEFSYVSVDGKIDVEKNTVDLIGRCEDCRKLHEKEG